MPIAGVARSIESDVDNLMRLISVANVIPKVNKVLMFVWGVCVVVPIEFVTSGLG